MQITSERIETRAVNLDFALIMKQALLLAILGSLQVSAQSQPMQEGFVEVPGARIHYKDSGGHGVPVIFLHANTGTADAWEKQVPAFTGAGYRFIAYDRRGWGNPRPAPAARRRPARTICSRSPTI